MSKVLWCDKGNHPFKAGEIGSQQIQGTIVDENGIQQVVTMDCCRLHGFNAAIESGPQDASGSQ